MKPLLSTRKMISLQDGCTRYRGRVDGVTSELLGEILRDMAPNKPLTGLFATGGVWRDRDGTREWAKWYCHHQQEYFKGSEEDNYRLLCILLMDEAKTNLNIIFRLEPDSGEGSVSFRSFVVKHDEDSFVCFEY